MKIAIYTEPLPPAFAWDPKNPWRGTEEFYVQTARALVELGHEVDVFYDGPPAQDQAFYRPRAEYKGGYDVVLCCNTQPPSRDPGTKYVYWTNLWGDKIERHLWADAHVTISSFASQEYGALGDDEPKIRAHVVGHGLDPEDIPAERPTKEPIALYSSSMDRGGRWLQAVWGSFGITTPDGTPIKLVCTEGKKTNAEMRELYRKAMLWLHPGLGVELFCISALKARAAGCLCVYSPIMALPETIGPGHIEMGSFRWKAALKKRIDERLTQPLPEIGSVPTWLDVTKQLEAVLKGVLG